MIDSSFAMAVPFYIGVQNMALQNNTVLNAFQWMFGNVMVLSMFLASIIIYTLFTYQNNSENNKRNKQAKIAFTSTTILYVLFFIVFNLVSFNANLSVKDVITKIIEEKPQIADKIDVKQISKLQSIGSHSNN